MAKHKTKLSFWIGLCLLYGSYIQAHAALRTDLYVEYHLDKAGQFDAEVNTMVQDMNGQLWLGTDRGLFRYDGNNLFCYNVQANRKGLLSDSIRVLYVDHQGELWVGSNKGLNKYMQESDAFQTMMMSAEYQAVNSVNAIVEDIQQRLWIGTDQGLFCGNSAEQREFYIMNTAFGKASACHINALEVLNDGRLWAFVKGTGLCWFDPYAARLTIDAGSQTGKEALSLATKSVSMLKADSKDRLWMIGQGVGLFSFDLNDGTLKQHADPLVTEKDFKSMAFDQYGRLWLCSDEQLFYWKEGFRQFQLKEIKGQRSVESLFDCLYVDRLGALWVGMETAIIRSVLGEQVFYNYHYQRTGDSPGFNAYNVFSLLAEDKGIWLGTQQGLVFVEEEEICQQTITSEKQEVLSKQEVKHLLRDRQGTLWLGTENGLQFYDESTHTIQKAALAVLDQYALGTVAVRAMLEDRQGNLWVAYSGIGVLCLAANRQQANLYLYHAYVDEALAGNYVKTIYEDQEGKIWLGGTKGLSCFLKEKMRFEHYFYQEGELFNGLNSPFINVLYEDQKGNLWVGTAKGIYRFDPLMHYFELFEKQEHALAHSRIFGIQEDSKGALWISTNQGLFFYDAERSIVSGFSEADGLYVKEFICAVNAKDSQTESLYFGTKNGFVMLKPEHLNVSRQQSLPVLTGFQLYDSHKKADKTLQQWTEGKQKIELNYRQNHFSFGYKVWHSHLSASQHIAYKLEGYDERWFELKENQMIRYRDVPSGNYSFHIRAKNAFGEWSPQQAEVELKIAPPVWASRGFKLFVLCLLLLLAFVVYRWRLKNMRKYRELLKALVDERTAEVLLQKEEIRIQFELLEEVYSNLQGKSQYITNSLIYARQIQQACLPRLENIKKVIPDCFIFFKPRDVVSGDFFWFAEKEGKIILAVVDCTGHGVPGAFMSMAGNTLLRQLVYDMGILQADEILSGIHQGVRKALRQDETENQDGMDISLCVIDLKESTLEYAGAKHPLLVIREGELNQIRGDRFSIGGVPLRKERHFTRHRILIDQPITFYMYTDGYADQFGGERGRRFLSSRLRKLLQQVYNEPMVQQEKILKRELQDWMGAEYSQLDDILVMGFVLRPESQECVECAQKKALTKGVVFSR